MQNMQNRVIHFFLFFFFIAFTIFFALPKQGEAIGISPPKIIISSILRDTTQQRKVTLVRSPSETEDFVIKAQAGGPFAHYLKTPETFFFPANKESVEYLFEITPSNAAIGEYEIPLVLTYTPAIKEKESQGNSIGVLRGVKVLIQFTVGGEQILEYTASDLSVSDTEVGMPLIVSYAASNTGNTDWKSEKIQFLFADIKNLSNITQATVEGDQIPVVKPGAQGERVALELSTPLIVGTYTVKANFFPPKETLDELSSKSFIVFPQGTLRQSGELLSIKTNKLIYLPDEKIKLEAEFKNTGSIRLRGALTTEISKGNTLLDILRSDEVVIERGETSTFNKIFTFNEPGKYTLSSLIEYGNKKTKPEIIKISVNVPTSPVFPIIAAAAATLLLLTLICYVMYSCRKKKLIKNKK
jgi:hypothetical protein